MMSLQNRQTDNHRLGLTHTHTNRCTCTHTHTHTYTHTQTDTHTHLLSITLHSCLQNSMFLSKGVIIRRSSSCRRARLRRHERKLSLSISSSCSGVVEASHDGLTQMRTVSILTQITFAGRKVRQPEEDVS